MESQLAKDARSGAPPVPRPDLRREVSDQAQARLARAARLAAALLAAPAARAYIKTPSRVELQAIFPPAPDGPGEDPQAHRAALDALRLGVPMVQAWSESRHGAAGPERGEIVGGTHLAVPLKDEEGRLGGALVVSDPRRSGWSGVEVENLVELGSMVLDSVYGKGSDRGAPPRDIAAGLHTGSSSRTTGGAHPGAAQLFSEARDAALVEIIRQSIVGSLHLGALRAGDRLPSIRQTARAFSVTPYMVLQAYAELEVVGLVERRERSGVFVANFEVSAAATLPETGAWLTEVLTQACQHQVKIPLLPDLIRRWTTAVRVRCACIESCLDSRFALAIELSQQFGIDPVLVSAQATVRELREADLIITTAYHAADLGPLVAEAGKPLLIATVSPLILSSALNHLRDRALTVICVDPAYGERLRALQGGAYRERVRVVRVDDAATLAGLDRAEAVLLTPAARQRLEQPDFRLIAPMYPSYSLDFARKVAEALVRINLQGTRA